MTPAEQTPITVDTNVESYVYCNDPIGQPYLVKMEGHRAVISFQRYEELMFGTLNANWDRDAAMPCFNTLRLNITWSGPTWSW